MVQMFDELTWKFMVEKSQYFSGQTTFIIHDPNLDTIQPETLSDAEGNPKEDELDFDLTDVPEVGKVTKAKLEEAGIVDIDQLAELTQFSDEDLQPVAEAAHIKLERLRRYAENAKSFLKPIKTQD